MSTTIEWAEDVWNPVVGCSVVSPGCTNCYAMRLAPRLARMGAKHYEGLTEPSKAGPVWNGKKAAGRTLDGEMWGWYPVARGRAA